MDRQPAHKSYVFDKAYRDVRKAFATTWGQTFDKGSMEKMFSNVLLFIPNLIVFLVITVFRVILNSIISICLIVVFVTAAPPVYIGFVIVAFLDFLYRLIRRISSMCPICQHRFDLPTYICPSCGVHHTRLIPSQYGIFKRKCQCGHKLPTTFFNGRQKLKSICPHCQFGMEASDNVNICIPVVGGASAGKTCFIVSAIAQLEQISAKKGYNFQYVNNGLNEYESMKKGMEHGYLPEKTGATRLTFYQFYMTPKEEKTRRLVSICDVAGETYEDGDLVGSQIGFRYADAFLVLIDPLSISEYREELAQTTDLSKYGASVMTIDTILSRLVRTLENLYSISSNSMLKTDVAIVFTKCDLPGLDAQIGRSAVDAYIRSHTATRDAATNILCENFLRKYSEDNFLNNVKTKFKSVQYFTCSALGDVPQGKGFTSKGVDAPIMWLMKKIMSQNKSK